MKCYSGQLVTADRADVIVDWLNNIKPSGCTSMLDAIKVTYHEILSRFHNITNNPVSYDNTWSRSHFISNRRQPGSEGNIVVISE